MPSMIYGDEDGNDNVGKIVIVEGDGAQQPRYVEISNLADAQNPPETTGLIITGSGGAMMAAAQVRPTLGDAIYAYGFGARPGEMTVNGVAFSAICPSQSALGGGLLTLLQFFEKYNHGVYAEPLLLTLQPAVVRDGFLNRLQWNYSQAGTRLIEFSLGLTLLP